MLGFENPEVLILLILALPGLIIAAKSSGRYQTGISLLHTSLIALLVLAVASPYITTEVEADTEQEIVLLKDESTSSSLIQEHELDLGGIELREKVIASGNESDLKEGFERNMEPNTEHLVISDFQSETSLEEIGELSRDINATLNAFQPDMHSEASVSVEGPDSTVPGASNTFRIKTHSTTEEKSQPIVYLDDQRVSLEEVEDGEWEFEHSFSEKGSYSITAEINHNGVFERNDHYYHAVNVIDKPEILIVGEKGELGDQLEEFYEVEHAVDLPEEDQLDEYYTVIATEKPSYEPLEYVSRGNGFIYTGEYEEDTNILPVREDPDADEEEGAKVMVVLDISHASGGCSWERVDGEDELVCEEDETRVHEAIQIGYNLIEELPHNNRVGVAAFNNDAHLVGEPETLLRNRDFLLERITQIEPEGPSYYHKGLKAGEDILEDEGNIILITDGKRHSASEAVNALSRSRDIADRLDNQLITIGVGEDPNQEFLEDIADRADGFYLDAHDAGRLEFQFDAGGADGETVPLAVTNPNHFITEGLELSSSATYFDPVEPKRGADVLATSTDGREFLTTWRYGIGRVAAFTGGSQDLSEISDFDPELLTRTVSWSVGDPERKEEDRIDIDSSRYPDSVEVSSSENMEDLTRRGEQNYATEIEPETLGFHSFNGELYDYNYNPEIENIGYSEEIRDVVSATGGQIYEPGDEARMEEELLQTEETKTITQQNLSNYLLALALLLFLMEVGYRKIKGKK